MRGQDSWKKKKKKKKNRGWGEDSDMYSGQKGATGREEKHEPGGKGKEPNTAEEVLEDKKKHPRWEKRRLGGGNVITRGQSANKKKQTRGVGGR